MAQDPGKRRRGRPPKLPTAPGEKPELTDKQWRGLKRELGGCEDLGDWTRGGWPSTTPVQTIANAAGVTRRGVYNWREDPVYAAGLVWLENQRLNHRLENNDRAIAEARSKMAAEALIELLGEDAPNESVWHLNKHQQKGETDKREFWVEPDPSLFHGDGSRDKSMSQRDFEMVAEELLEVLGEDALSTATSRAAEFQRKGTADQRKFWTRLANAIQEILDRRPDNATKKISE